MSKKILITLSESEMEELQKVTDKYNKWTLDALGVGGNSSRTSVAKGILMDGIAMLNARLDRNEPII